MMRFLGLFAPLVSLRTRTWEGAAGATHRNAHPNATKPSQQRRGNAHLLLSSARCKGTATATAPNDNRTRATYEYVANIDGVSPVRKPRDKPTSQQAASACVDLRK